MLSFTLLYLMRNKQLYAMNDKVLNVGETYESHNMLSTKIINMHNRDLLKAFLSHVHLVLRVVSSKCDQNQIKFGQEKCFSMDKQRIISIVPWYFAKIYDLPSLR